MKGAASHIMEDKTNNTNRREQPDTTASVHLPRTEAAVRAYASTEYNTDPSGSWTGRPAISAAVRGGKVCVRIKDDFNRPTQDADDL